MSKFFRIVALLLVVCAMLALAFTGYEGKVSINEENTDVASKESSTDDDGKVGSTPDGKEPVEIVYTCWGNAAEKKSTEEVLKKFQEKYPWIKVKPIIIPNGQYDRKITTMVAAGEQLDLSQLESASIAYPLAEQGKLMNLKEVAVNDTEMPLSSFVPTGLYYLDKDTIIGVGTGMEVFNIFYNKDLFAEAGVETPPTDPEKAWTWDQFVETAKKLTIDKEGRNALNPAFDEKNIVQYGVNIPKWWGVWGNFIYSNGGDYITEDGQFGLSKPEATEALQKIADLIHVHHVSPAPTAEKGLPGTDIALQTKKIAMAVDGQWVHLALDSAKTNFGSGVLPKLKELKTQAVTGMLSIFKGSASPEACWQLIKYLNDPAQDLTLYRNGNLMPVAIPWLTEQDKLDQWTKGLTSRPDGYVEGIVGMLLNYSVPTPTGTVKNFSRIIDVVNAALDKVWLGQQSAADAMKEAEAKVKPLIQSRRERGNVNGDN